MDKNDRLHIQCTVMHLCFKCVSRWGAAYECVCDAIICSIGHVKLEFLELKLEC